MSLLSFFRKKSSLSLDDLLKIKEGIETTEKWLDKGISEVEYQWLYTSRQPLLHLERNVSDQLEDQLDIVFQLLGKMSIYSFPEETDAIAHIHNHPSGVVLPSVGDITLFLQKLRYPSLKYALIAATSESLVSGFYCLEYQGNRANVEKLIDTNDKIYERICSKRHKDILTHREKYSHLAYSNCVFTTAEMIAIPLLLMELSHIEHYALSMPGYKFQDWRFVKE